MRQEESQPIMVTIHCTVYNHEPYIRKCLEGFVMQKTNFRFEAIVHDDASTDGSVAIIREFEKKYPDIIKPIYETENQWSKHDGSLKCIMDEHTFGKYVALCEGDDYWIAPNKLQKQVDFLESHPDYTMCWHDAYIETHGIIKEAYNRYPTNCQSPIEDIILEGGLFIPTASIVIPRNVFINRPPEAKICDYTLQMYSAYMGKAYYFALPLCVYRYMSIGSWTSKMSNETIEQKQKRYEGEKNILEIFNKLFEYRYNEYFEKRSSQVLFFLSYLLKDYKNAKEYMLLRDKYHYQTDIIIRLEVNGHPLLARLFCKYKRLKKRIKSIIYYIKTNYYK